jgi:hypothetical protein
MIDIARAVGERLTLLLVLLASVATPTIVEYIQSFVMREPFDIEQTVLVSLLLAVLAIPFADLVEIKARLKSRRAPLVSKIRKALLVTTTFLLLITIIVYATVHALPSDQTNTDNIFLCFYTDDSVCCRGTSFLRHLHRKNFSVTRFMIEVEGLCLCFR